MVLADLLDGAYAVASGNVDVHQDDVGEQLGHPGDDLDAFGFSHSSTTPCLVTEWSSTLAKLADPAAPLRPTARRILLILRDGGPQRLDQLAARLTAAGRRPIRPATAAAALGELQAAGLAAVDDHDQDELTGRWTALPVTRDPLLDAVELHGAHDLRHTYATWLEDAGIPARVIDELMGHQASSRGGLRGSAIGAHYRHTTPEMAARVVEAIQQRLTVVLQVAERSLERYPIRPALRVF